MDVLFGVRSEQVQRFGLHAVWLVAGLAVALVPALWMRGFTVDDALISVRYARHLAAGTGWRFDNSLPTSDGVTPLPWPLLLWPFAHAAPLVVLGRAKLLGLVAWTGTGAALGEALGRQGRSPGWARAGALGVLALSVPVAAYAVSGMETPLATALATFGVLSARRPWLTAALAGAATTLRPELAPWACVLSLGVAMTAGWPASRVVPCGLAALAPFALVAVARVLAWGHPGPLALLAKPSDLAHGFAYAGAGLVVGLTPLLALAPVALTRSGVALSVVAAAAAHAVAVVLAGGDWMPYARLFAPVLPGLAFAGALVAADAARWATALRTALGAGVGALLLAHGGTSGRDVGDDRAALIAAASPELAGARRVAALDVGWVSAATEADVVDLAGVTDPAIAALPGGHTSKRVDGTLLLERDPDVLLLYAPIGLPGGDLEAWPDATYTRVLEQRLAGDPLVRKHFAPAAWLPLGRRGAGYVLLRRVRE